MIRFGLLIHKSFLLILLLFCFGSASLQASELKDSLVEANPHSTKRIKESESKPQIKLEKNVSSRIIPYTFFGKPLIPYLLLGSATASFSGLDSSQTETKLETATFRISGLQLRWKLKDYLMVQASYKSGALTGVSWYGDQGSELPYTVYKGSLTNTTYGLHYNWLSKSKNFLKNWFFTTGGGLSYTQLDYKFDNLAGVEEQRNIAIQGTAVNLSIGYQNLSNWDLGATFDTVLFPTTQIEDKIFDSQVTDVSLTKFGLMISYRF